MQKVELATQRFGRLLVIEQAQSRGKKIVWNCHCDCGAQCSVRSELLRSGRAKSCGCLRREVASAVHRKHGRNKSPERSAYDHMMARCTDPKNERFGSYGARGITVCDRWQESFEQFLDDMGPRPDGYSLERVNVHRGYGPDNCKWIPAAEQSKNTTRTVRITYKGRTMCAADWAKETGIKASVIYYRASKGLPPERILRAA